MTCLPAGRFGERGTDRERGRRREREDGGQRKVVALGRLDVGEPDEQPEPPPLGAPDPDPEHAPDKGPDAMPGIPTEGEPPAAS